jgi:hypothetical protein
MQRCEVVGFTNKRCLITQWKWKRLRNEDKLYCGE